MVKIKQFFAIFILIALCTYSTWKGMQTLAIVSISLLLLVLYKDKSMMIFDLFFKLARQTKQAKIGNFELNISETFKQTISENLKTEKEWVKAIFSDLTPSQLTILLAVEKAGKFHCGGHMKNTLRELRDKGLIMHNKNSMANSDIVWLTDIGVELVKELFKDSKFSDNNE